MEQNNDLFFVFPVDLNIVQMHLSQNLLIFFTLLTQILNILGVQIVIAFEVLSSEI
jgi:hypothetical protein